MKLYTEEQVRQSIAQGFDWCHQKHIPSDYMIDAFIKELTTIELPSDEEIDSHVEDDFLNSTEVHKYSEEVQLLMKAMCKAGMKYMRDKIQGGNK